MISNVNNVIEWLKLNKLTYWVVQLKDTDNTRVFESDEKLSFEDNMSLFQRVMDVSSGSRFIIKASDSKESKRGKFSEEFRNMPDVPGVGTTMHQQAQITDDTVQALVKKGIDEYKREVEFETLKRERDEYKREAERRLSVGEQVMERSLPYIGTIFQYFISKYVPGTSQVAVAGLSHENSNNNNSDIMEGTEINFTDEQTDRVEAALQLWAKSDHDMIVLLENIAAMAARNDQMYNMAKPMLLK